MTNLNANYEDEERIMFETETEFKWTSIQEENQHFKVDISMKYIYLQH